MAFRRRSRSFAPRRRPRRRTDWARTATFNAAPASATVDGLDLLAAYRTAMGVVISLPGITIGRVRISISVRIAIPAAGLQASDGVGFGLIKDQITRPTLGLLLPQSDPNADWMMHAWMAPAKDSDALVTTAAAVSYVMTKEFDVKSMRKLAGDAESLFAVVQTTGAATLVNVNYNADVLLYLP